MAPEAEPEPSTSIFTDVKIRQDWIKIQHYRVKRLDTKVGHVALCATSRKDAKHSVNGDKFILKSNLGVDITVGALVTVSEFNGISLLAKDGDFERRSKAATRQCAIVECTLQGVVEAAAS